MSNLDKAMIAEQAEAALSQFLRPSFDVLRREYERQLSTSAALPLSLEVRAAITNLSVALKVLNLAQRQIEELVLDGKIAKSEIDRSAKMAALTTEAHRWANF